MPRPRCCRRVSARPSASSFGPTGAAGGENGQVHMTLDEFEALRLADLEGLYQAAAAERMGVSRATLGRILAVAHRKVAQALVEGKRLIIEGGSVYEQAEPVPTCPRCAGRFRGRGDCPHCHRSGT